MERHARRIVAGAGVTLTALLVALSRIGGPNERVGLLLALFAAAFAAYLVAVASLRFLQNGGRSRRGVWFALAVAVAGRLVLVPSQPQMSTDVFRYVWEGRVITHGFNPFAHAPDAPELRFLRDRYYEDVSHKHMTTIYPPLSQAVFALAARVRPDPLTLKFVFVLFDLGVIGLIGALLKRRSIDPAAALVYAWNPLVIFETAHSGHLEPVGIFFLLLGIWLIARGRRFWGFAALGASLLVKYLAAVFIAFFTAKKRYAPWVAVTVAVAAVGYVPFAGAGGGLYSSFRAYLTEWQFNGLAFELLERLLGDPAWARRILAAVLIAVIGFSSWRQSESVRFGFVVVGTGLLVAPTLYPWYVVWIVPFLCFYPNRAWILFTGLVFSSYWVWMVYAASGRWELPWIIYALEYAPFYALLIYDAVRARRHRRMVET